MTANQRPRGAAFTPLQRPNTDGAGKIPTPPAVATVKRPEGRAPFNQRGGLGKAHQLFGEQLPKLLNELNEALAA